jgi:hypothetical protein
MTRLFIALVLVLGLASFYLPAAENPLSPAAPKQGGAVTPLAGTPGEEAEKKKLDPAHVKMFTEALGAKPGVAAGRVHTLTLPRTDLEVRTLEMGEIPTEAGLASTFRIFRCACGKYFVIGEFCVVDYESQDVIDSLRKGHLQIASVAPMLIQDTPRIVLVRFQGEGQPEALAGTFKDAVQWIGENRTRPNPIPK